MGVDATLPTSRRGYLSQDELKQFANITITDATEADDRISQAEEMIDAFVGHQDKWMNETIDGRVASVPSSTTFYLQTNQRNYDVSYFTLCQVEILGGTGAGQRRKITASTREGLITVDSAFTSLDTTSFYRISQLGKFPRCKDVVSYSEQTPITYYKQIPEAVKRAVAAQIEYQIEMGDAFFKGESSQLQSERIGDYSYDRGDGKNMANGANMISPKAKMLLKGIRNRIGAIVY